MKTTLEVIVCKTDFSAHVESVIDLESEPDRQYALCADFGSKILLICRKLHKGMNLVTVNAKVENDTVNPIARSHSIRTANPADLVRHGLMAAEDLFYVSQPMTLRELEIEYINHVLGRFGGRRSEAAQALGVTVRTLYNKLK